MEHSAQPLILIVQLALIGTGPLVLQLLTNALQELYGMD